MGYIEMIRELRTRDVLGFCTVIFSDLGIDGLALANSVTGKIPLHDARRL